MFYRSLAELANLSLNDERYTHAILVPLISAVLIYADRHTIFANSEYNLKSGVPVALAGALLLATGDLFFTILGLVIFWTGSFAACYGWQALRQAAFPVGFLLLMIPLPGAFVDRAVAFLQRGSAEVTYILFHVVDLPVFREGPVNFSLPGVQIKVAEECSGIRSANALFLTGLLAAYLFLKSFWNRTIVALLTIPIAIFKNAVRITVISWLGVYVNPGFFYGNLHHRGGLPFSLLALAMLIPVIFYLRRTERAQRLRKKVGEI